MKVKKCIVTFMAVGFVMIINITAFGVELLTTIPYSINKDSAFKSSYYEINKDEKPIMKASAVSVSTSGWAYGVMYKKGLFKDSQIDYEYQKYERVQTKEFSFAKALSAGDYRFVLQAEDMSSEPTGLRMTVGSITLTY